MNKKKLIIGTSITFVTVLIIGLSFYISSMNNNKSDSKKDSNTNTTDENTNVTDEEDTTTEEEVTCEKTVASLDGQVINNSCEEYHFIIEDKDLDIKAKLTTYDESGHYTLKLTVNDKNVTNDFFTNKEKQAIVGSVLIYTYEDYIIVKSDSTSQYNGQYVTVINKTGKVLFTAEDAMIVIDKENIEVTRTVVENAFYQCDDTSDNRVLETKTMYKISNNDVVKTSSEDITCLNQK